MRKANKAPRGPIRMRAHAKPSFSFGRTVIKLAEKKAENFQHFFAESR